MLSTTQPPKILKIKVFDLETEIHEECIELPFEADLWEDYMTSDEMLFIPNTILNSKYGLDIRLTCIPNDYFNFSLIITQKASSTKYSYSFILDDKFIYQINFIPPAPWQLDTLHKPCLPQIELPLQSIPSLNAIPKQIVSDNYEIMSLDCPILDQFVKDMKNDPLALAQYVYNEIELEELFMWKVENTFQASGIHRHILKTFLDKHGSAWEQCMLLAYLLQKAGYQTQFIEGHCLLPASHVEKLLFLQLPGENTTTLNYPGVLFSDGKNSQTLFPWLKEIHCTEGHEIYSLLPEEYGNAEKWLKHYLENDENILKHVGSDENDTVGILFVKFLEEQLRLKGLSLHDVGTHRKIQKKQFSSWIDFPRPLIEGKYKCVNLATNDIFSKIKLTYFSEQNPHVASGTQWINLCNIGCETIVIDFPEINGVQNQLLTCLTNQWEQKVILPLQNSDHTIKIKVDCLISIGSDQFLSQSKEFTIQKGTKAALCHQFGSTNYKLTSFFAEKFNKEDSPEKKLFALFSFIGANYFEKCSNTSKSLATFHKINPSTYFSIGLSKLSPDPASPNNPIFPQIDMQHIIFDKHNHKNLFSIYQDSASATHQYNILAIGDISSNEHQVLRDIYKDRYAISTVKLLQIAHKNHKRKNLSGSGFLLFTHKRFNDADLNPLSASSLYFPNIENLDLLNISKTAKTQWENLRAAFSDNPFQTFAYMTPGKVSSEDGFGLKPPSYTGTATLLLSPSNLGAWISDGSRIMNGGFGSSLSNDFLKNLLTSELQINSKGSNYNLTDYPFTTNFDGVTSAINLSSYSKLPNFTLSDPNHSLSLDDVFIWNDFSTKFTADVRLNHKTQWDAVADPVDVVSGAFYVDELDLLLPGTFPLEIRRNYNSQNPQAGILGVGWKLSLNPFLHEEDNKIFATEQDGTVIVYRYDHPSNKWLVTLEDNPDLKNCSNNRSGGTSNPFHAYITKTYNGYILYGADGSQRIFSNNLLKTWTDHIGNSLSFSYNKNEQLIRIENSSEGVLCFEYNYLGLISEVFAKDGRRISYCYDFQGNLSSVTLPNNAIITYEYDKQHRIIREIKSHGRVLENIYKNNKVIEQRSPVGPNQQMATSATFLYNEGITLVEDALGAQIEYKIHKNQIYKITDPQGNQILQSWFIDRETYFDAETEKIERCDGLRTYPRSVKSTKDKRGLITDYFYDEKGNQVEISLIGEDLTGSGEHKISKQFHYNDRNLCIEEVAINTKNVTHYDSHFPYLPCKMETFIDNTLISFIDLEYSSNGLVKKTNQSGSITLFEYDHRDFPLKKVQKTGTDDPDVVTHFFYNNQGQCVDILNADSIIHNEYDIVGNNCCTTISLPSGKIFSKTYSGYDLNNERIWEQGDNIHDTIFLDYNASGLLKATRKSLTQFNGSKIEPIGTAYNLYEYDVCGRLSEKIDALGNCIYNSYDSLGRLSTNTQNGLTTRYSYEAGGLLATKTSPGGATSTKSYTSNGLLKSEINPEGKSTNYVYDLLGRLIQETHNSTTTTIQYNDAKLERIHSQGALSETRKFDERGNLILFLDKDGYTWSKTYDALNRVKTETSPNGEITSWKYLGDTTICTLPSGETIVQRSEAGTIVETQTFSIDGSLIRTHKINNLLNQSMVQEVNGEAVTTIWKNTLGKPIHTQQGNVTTTNYYDALGNCITSVDGDGNITQQKFDPCGRIIEKVLSDGATVCYEYDEDSNLIAYRMPGNLNWKATYDCMGRKTSEWQESNGKKFQKWRYIYHNDLLSESFDPLNRHHIYEYDMYSRLILTRVNNHSRNYTYNNRGLLESVVELGKDLSTIKRSYDESGRLTNEIISLNGKEIQNTQQNWSSSSRSLSINGHTRNYNYQAGLLKNISSSEMSLSYDYANGALIQKTTPCSTLEIKRNNSLLPTTTQFNFADNCYQESIQWTSTGKLSTYSATYPKTPSITYDYTARGLLKSANECNYVFDFDKPGRGILTYAPGLEVKSDGLDEYGRIVKETIDSVSCTTAYDDMGQVILHGMNQLQWDPWGRLVEFKNDTYEWTASYDALGRRLQTTYTPLKNYYLFKSRKTSIITNSLYDPEIEFEEIGIVRGKQIFWKFCGQSSCDAISDSNGNTLYLQHDIKNNLLATYSAEEILWNENYPSPYGPEKLYEEFDDLSSYTKSLTWQSKRVDPTGLIWLGARYYDPIKGRFLSPDPISHPACLDLYSYGNGDPINNADLDGRYSNPVFGITDSTTINKGVGLPTIRRIDNYESYFCNENLSKNYNLKDYGFSELPKGLRIGFINGIENDSVDFTKSLMHLSKLSGGYNIYGTYGGCINSEQDRLVSELALNYIDTGRIQYLHQAWDDFFNKDPDGYYLHFCHSRGAIDTRNALLAYSEEKRKRIVVVAIAPAAYIYSETCAKVTHYRVPIWRDFVPYLDRAGQKREKHTIKELPSNLSWNNISLHDHSFNNSAYEKPIRIEIRDFISEYRKRQ